MYGNLLQADFFQLHETGKLRARSVPVVQHPPIIEAVLAEFILLMQEQYHEAPTTAHIKAVTFVLWFENRKQIISFGSSDDIEIIWRTFWNRIGS
jgi:hypothetical protein